VKASELVAKLQKKIEEVGDLPITADLGCGTVVVVAAYDDEGRSLQHNDAVAKKPTRIHIH
jgi:phage tail sheath gpL-like